MADYKIELGVKLKDNDIQTQINDAQKTLKPIELKIDAETKELTNTIREALNSLSKGTKNALTLDTSKIEVSLDKLSSAITDIKNSLGTLDDKSGMKNLISSINQIATALGKVENESDNLVKSLSALSKKDFSINFGIDMGKKNNNMIAYGRAARKQVIPELEAQIKYLENLFGGQQAAMSKLTSKGSKVGFDVFADFADFNSDSAIKKMEAMEKYINSLKKLAALDNVNLDGFYSAHSQGATELINDIAGVEDAVDKAGNVSEKLKSLFGGNIDGENLSMQLDSIVVDLGEIKTALQGLSSGVSLDGLTQSFDRLSETLERLVSNAALVKTALGDELGAASSVPSSASNAVKSAQQIGQKIGETISKTAKQTINIDDILDQRTLDLMDKYSIAGDKGSKAFNEIRQSLVECRNELNILNNSDIGIDEEVFDTSRAVDKVTDAIANQMRAVNNLGDEYVELANYMTRFNDPAKGNKVRLPDVVKQEQGDDYRTSRGILGNAFNTKRGISFVDFINDLNHELGDTISLTNGEAAAMDELLRKVELGRQQRDVLKKNEKSLTSTASTEEILEQNGIDRNEIYGDVMSIVDVVSSAEQQMAQVSSVSANTVVQNEERKQQSYQETSGVIENLKATLETMKVDRSSIDTVIKDMEELGFTATDTSVKMKNGGFDITVKGVDSIGRAITEIRHLDSATDEISLVDRKITQSLTETDRFVKQQKQAVSNLTNQINQLNRSAIDQNAARPIKDAAHLDALADKYDEITLAIQRMESTSSDTFVDEQNNVKKLISEYKSLVSEFKNAENVSNKMKGTDFASGLDIAKNDLEKFKAQAKDFPQIIQTIENLDKAIEGVGDAASLNEFNDQLRVARSELAKIKSETAAVNKSEKVGINVSGLESKIVDLQRISPEIDKFETEIDGAKVNVQSLLNDLKQVNTQSDFSVVNSKWRAFTDAAKAAGIAVTETASKTKSALANDIKFDIEVGNFDEQMDAMRTKFNSLSDANTELRTSVKLVEEAYESMLAAANANTGDEVADRERLIQAEKEYAAALERTNNLIKQQARVDKTNADAIKLQDNRDKFQAKIDAWMVKNSAATKRFGADLLDLRAKAEQADQIDLNHLEAELYKIDKAADKAGLKMQSMGDRVKSKFKEYMAYFSVAEVFMWVEQALKNMFEQVKLIDSAMTELKKVTNETDAAYNKFLSNAANRAKEIGTTIDGLVSSTADFARLGYSMSDAANLAEVANIYAVVGDDIDSVETATESLISTMTAFGIEASNSISIVDKFNIVGNNFAISSGGIGEALERSASSMAAANNTLDETIALITAANTVVQDADAVGTAFKTISMRIRGATTDLEEAGLDTEGMASSTAKLREEIMALSGVDIMLDSTTFKSTYKIMEELAAKWQDLTDIQQASVTELIAGKRQGNIVSSLMTNFDIAQNALQTSINSSGSAMEEHEKYMDSIEAKLSQLSAAWQSFAQTFMDSDFLKNGIDALKGLVEILETLIDNFGILGTTGIGVLGTGIFKYFTNFKKNFKDIADVVDVVDDAIDTMGNVGDTAKNITDAASNASGAMADLGGATKKTTGAFKAFMKTPIGVASAIGVAIAAITLIYNQYKKTKEAAAEARQEAIQASNEYLTASKSFEQAYIKYSGKTDLTAEEESELESAIKGTVDALGDKSSALQSVVNSSDDYLASLDRIAEAEIKASARAAKAKRDNAAKELKEAAIGYETFDGSEVDVTIDVGKSSKEYDIANKMNSKFLKDSTLRGRGVAIDVQEFILPKDANVDEIVEYYNTLLDYQERLSDADLGDTVVYERVSSAIEKMSEAVGVYTDGLYEASKAEYQLANGIPKTTEEYLEMRKSILGSKGIKGASFDTLKSIANTLDSEYSQVFDLSAAEFQSKKFIGVIDKYGNDEAKQVETFLNMRTAVNNNECTVGEYMSQLDDIGKITNDWDKEEKEEFNASFGINTDKIEQQYKEVYNYIKRNYLKNLDTTGLHIFDATEYKISEKRRIQDLLKGLTATELNAVANIKGEINWETTNTDDILTLIRKEAEFIEAMSYTIAIDIETESLDALNSALSESVSGVGLSSESITALKGRYAELASQGYDLSAMFEETSNGIHLNKNAVSEFERVLASQKLSETDSKLGVLKDRYDELTNEIDNCADAGKRANLYSEQQEVAQKINDLATLTSQYKGLTSAYNAWQNAESAGNERDMYENIIEGFETIGDEISRGWYDDGTIKFLELMTGQTDLAGKSASELKEIWNSLDDTIQGTSYSVKDFFTTDEDGNSTSTGAYNFLRAVEELGKNGTLKALEGKNIEDLIVRNKKNQIVGFDFDVVGGDGAIAKALGVSEEMVQIIQRTLDDAGFVVTLDGKYTLLADLKTSAEEANNSLKKLQSEGLKNLKDVDLNFDFNVDTVEGYQEQLEKALNVLDKFRNKDGTLQTDSKGNLVEGAKNALEIAEYYTAAMDKLTEPKFMQIDISTVDEELQKPIEKMQKIGDLCKEKHLVSLTGDTKELDKVQKEIDKVAEELAGLDEDVKAEIGIDPKWDAKEIADKIEKGEIEIPADLKIDVQMSKDLKDMRLMMMRELGLVSDEEVKLKVGYEIDESTVDDLTPDKQKVVVEFISKNEDWFNKLTDNEKKVVIELTANGVDLDSLTNDEEKEIVVEFVTKNKDIWDKLSDEEKQAVVKYVAKHDEVDKWEPEDKEALVRLIVDKDNVDNWKPEDIDAVVKYYADDEQVKKWTPEQKKAFAKYLVDGGDVEGWSPEAKDAFVKYLVDGGDPDKFDPDDKESWVVYDTDTTKPDNYNADKNGTVTYDTDTSKPDGYNADKNGTVTYDKNSSVVDQWNPDKNGTVKFNKDTSVIDKWKPVVTGIAQFTLSMIIPQRIRTALSKIGISVANGTANANGTAFINGTTGRAFKQGNWGAKGSGTALMGELGQELVVRDGRWFTVGDSGAGFYQYEKGDIIFNHKQTEELFKNGKVTSGGGRGKALVGGTAFAEGVAFGKGSGGGVEVNTTTAETIKSSKKTSSSNNSDDAKDEFEETLDWIEVAIDRIEREIDNLDTRANSVYRSWSERNTALVEEIFEVRKEINLQQKAYEEYMRAAAAVGLSSDWIRKIQNGAIDIDTITDEALKEKIDDYQKWYEAALDAKDAILELQETEKDLIQQRFDNIVTQYEGMLSIIEHERNMLEEYMNQSEAQGWLVSGEYYNALINNERETISKLQAERAALLAELGNTERGTEQWYENVKAIDEITLSIAESETAILEWQQAIQQLDWEIFDLIQDKISAVTEEADFLIELLSSKKLFDDKGKLTDEGMATMGLHGVNYNTYMHMADEAGKEAERIKKQLASDPYDTELEERYREMISLQQEHILAAEQEKEAIRDLVEEGIEVELDALQELIDKKNEELESAKDLYEYQKRVEEQTKNIASLRKQLVSIEGDDSEEAKARIQELKVSLEEAEAELEETEYDKYIADTQRILDDLYLEYEQILNERLDNLDALIESVIAEINADASIISATISDAADSVGYTLSSEMETIWNSSTASINGVITMYGDKFYAAQTSVNSALSSIRASVQSMVTQLGNIARANAAKAATSSAGSGLAGSGVPSTNNKPQTTQTNNKPVSNSRTPTSDQLTGIAASIWVYGQSSGWGNDPIRSGKITEKFDLETAKKVQSIIDSKGPSGGLYDFWVKNNYNLDKYKYSAFKRGAKSIKKHQLAWTQEEGQEFIVRPSDGAILTPVAKGDSVLTSAASKNIWDMANSPVEFIKENLSSKFANVPNNSNSQSSFVQTIENVTFDLKNVRNYEEMLAQMQKDKNFEKLIMAMTVDRLTGGSSLAKGKAIR